MFGLLRTTFALMVMSYHLFAVGRLPLGTYAVFGFFVISGYLMTLVMQERYGYSLMGRLSFALNRALRLYPLYWIAALLSVALIWLLGQELVRGFHAAIVLPQTPAELLNNMFMIFPDWNPNAVRPRLVPLTWAITVELFYYALICCGASRNWGRVKVWLAVSLAYVIASFLLGWDWHQRYFTLGAGSLPFAIGAAIYFLSKSDVNLPARPLFVLMLGNCLGWALFSPYSELGFYLNLGLCSLIVYSLAKGGAIAPISANWDKAIGDYSYPLYLLHWQAGLVVSLLIFGEPFQELSPRGLTVLLVSLAFLAILSSLLIRLIDEPVQSVRSRVKALVGEKHVNPSNMSPERKANVF